MKSGKTTDSGVKCMIQIKNRYKNLNRMRVILNSSSFFLRLNIIWLLFSCKNSTKCDNTPLEFPNYETAMSVIKKNNSNFVDSLDVPEGKRIKFFWYYRCKKDFGYLFRRVNTGAIYFVSNVPIKVWEQLKASQMKENYYNENISEKYTSVIISVNLDSAGH